jgi:GDP-mannose 6-dehydrogenase
MKVAVFGLGYVGFTVACCLANDGHDVVGFDVSELKTANVNAGICPITEPDLEAMLKDALAARRIFATTNVGQYLGGCDVSMVCVGTPSLPDGSHDMRFITEVTRQIATHVQGEKRSRPMVVVYRSTIRPGTMEGLIAPIFEVALGSRFGTQVELVYNPEFLREATAVRDYFQPPKIVVGTADGQMNPTIAELYRNIPAPHFVVKFSEAEITKFVDNSWHATKVAFANEIGRICLQLGISAATVHQIFISDTKLNISTYYLRPGGAFGGSCLPKDVRALQHLSADCGANTPVIDALLSSNNAHKFRLHQLTTKGLAPGGKVLLVGIAFKADTDDSRESPNVDLARGLLGSGFHLSIYDPAIDAQKLVGANLGYAWSQLSELESLLVSKQEAETSRYDRVIAVSRTLRTLNLSPHQDILDLNQLQ